MDLLLIDFVYDFFIINTDFSISAQEEQQKALEARALELSLQYGFVTPLTSMVVTKPTGQQQAELANKPTEAGKWVLNSPLGMCGCWWWFTVDPPTQFHSVGVWQGNMPQWR